MAEDQTALAREVAQRAASALAQCPEVLAVALYGSVARGTASAWSDVDLLTIVDDSTDAARSLRARAAIKALPGEVSLSIHTISSLRRYLHQWSRFAVHLQQEGHVLDDRRDMLGKLLAERFELSVAHEIAAQRRNLASFACLDRFGGRFFFPLARLHGIGRTAVLAHLTQHDRIEFDRARAFAMLPRCAPRLSDEVEAIRVLKPFYDRVRWSDTASELPFSPVGEQAAAHAAGARAAIESILDVSEACCGRA